VKPRPSRLSGLAGLYQGLSSKTILRPLARDDHRARDRATHLKTVGDRRYVATHAHPRALLIGDDFAVRGQ
jgi:hypothetical protein